MSADKKNKKRSHYYVIIFVTKDGKIYVDFSRRNTENKVIFHRVDASKIVYGKKYQDWNILNEIKKIDFNLQKYGLELDDAPVEMISSLPGVSDKFSSYIYYVAIPKKYPKSNINENLVLMDLEDFLADDEIFWSEKLAVTYFFNGDSTVKWD